MIIIGQSRSLKGRWLGYLIAKKKGFFSNHADHAETISGGLVDFQKTLFHDSVRHSEA